MGNTEMIQKQKYFSGTEVYCMWEWFWVDVLKKQ
jgi:hypothetical protein